MVYTELFSDDGRRKAVVGVTPHHNTFHKVHYIEFWGGANLLETRTYTCGLEQVMDLADDYIRGYKGSLLSR